MRQTVIATFEVAPERREEFLARLALAVPEVLAEDGCLAYEPHTVGRDRVLLVESWASPESLAAHAKAEPLARFTADVASLVVAGPDVVVARPVLAAGADR